MWEQWGVKILAFPLTWHIAYTTACGYRTSRENRTGLGMIGKKYIKDVHKNFLS